MKKRLLDFLEYTVYRMPLKYSIPLTIASLIVCMISLTNQSLSLITMLILIISFFSTVLFGSNIVGRWFKKDLSKRNIESLERLKEKLTNEFQIVTLKTDKEDLINTVAKKAPYVFKAKIENDIVYYQFETKDGKIFDSGETTNFIWFENRII